MVLGVQVSEWCVQYMSKTFPIMFNRILFHFTKKLLPFRSISVEEAGVGMQFCNDKSITGMLFVDGFVGVNQ